jgi:hypothetical protein
VYDARKAMERGGYQQILEDTRNLNDFPERDVTLIMNYRAHARLGLGYHERARHDYLQAWNAMNMSEGGGVASAYFFTERQKWWIGDPFERMFNSWYLGMLFYMKGDLIDAPAAFRNAIFVDTGDIEAGQWAADWIPALLMLARCFLADGRDDDARIMLQQISDLPEEPASFDPSCPWFTLEAQKDANTIMMIELGKGPFFTAEGHHGSVRVINQGDYREAYAEVWIDGEFLGRAYKIGDTFFQAITRGGRVMDDILQGKAIAKTSSIVVGATGMHVGRVLYESGNRTAGAVAAGVGAALLLAGLLADASADTRGNVLLPGETHLMMAQLPPGDYSVELRFFDAGDRELKSMRQSGLPLHVPERGDAVLLARSHPPYAIPTGEEHHAADPGAE